VTRAARVLVLAGSAGSLTELADIETDVHRLGDLDRCLVELERAEQPVSVVAIDPSWPRPLTAIQRIRNVDRAVALALVVPPGEVDATRTKLALLPGAGDVTVLSDAVSDDDLRRELARAGASSLQRRRVRSALDSMNVGLQGGGPVRAVVPAVATVPEDYLAALVRHAPDTIISLDRARRTVTINGAGERIFRISASEVEGRLIGELLAADDPGRLLELVDAAEVGGPQVDDEVSLRLRDGRQLVVSVTAAPIREDVGQLAGFVVIVRDVTAERRSEQHLRALQKAESLSTLARGVAHDFNNLLVQVQGWADLASDDPTDADLVAEALRHIGEATRGASELARAMLAYGGRGEFEPRPVELADLVADLRPLLTAAIPAKIRLDIEPAARSEVRADATQLRQVILNLVANASEAIGDEVGVISVRTATETIAHGAPDARSQHPLAPGRYAVIEVEDTGPGIAADVEDRLFDPFFTTKFTGRGLGLAASQGIVRAHGGRISVEGRPGVGARFRVHLPLLGAAA
jgi:PAS domain S-box-containing protein